MIYIKILNPFCDSFFRNIYWKAFNISKNKTFEFQIYFCLSSLFELDIDLETSGMDHPKIGFSFLIIPFGMNVGVYDNRHWDYDKECFVDNREE